LAQIETPSAASLEDTIGDLEKRIERLKVLYEQFFLGNQRAEPLVARKDCTRKIIELQQINIRNTGLRFRFNTLVQRWNVYQSYWGRILRKIEQGTFVRDVQRAKRNMARRGRLAEQETADAESVETTQVGEPHTDPNLTPWSGRESGELEALSDDDLMPLEDDDTDAAPAERFTLAPVVAPVGLASPSPRAAGPTARPGASGLGQRGLSEIAPAARPALAAVAKHPGERISSPGAAQRPGAGQAPPPASPPVARSPRPATVTTVPDPLPGVSFDDMRAAYERYRDARRATGEAEVRYADMVDSLTRKVPALLERTGYAQVKIDVDVKDGKAVIRVKPKRP
jgi:hypothetical protein